MATAARTERKLEQLALLLWDAKTMLIAMQDNPDPDAIASAAALRALANAMAGTRCYIAHGGIIGRSENRELVRHLGLNLHSLTETPPSSFDLVAMVDTQPCTGNNSLPDDMATHIVIDHHPIRRATRKVAFSDIRSGYGATSTILFEYLRAADVEITPRLATSLLYGIRSDTQDLGRDAAAADVRAVLALYPLANKRELGRIQRGALPRSYFQALGHGLRQAQVAGPCIVTGLGDVDNPDMIAEVADLLLRNEGSSWALCHGVFDGEVLLSLRTSESEHHADKVMRRIVSRKGTGGGHNAMAGGQIPLQKGTKAERQKITELIRRRLLKATATSPDSWQPLL